MNYEIVQKLQAILADCRLQMDHAGQALADGNAPACRAFLEETLGDLKQLKGALLLDNSPVLARSRFLAGRAMEQVREVQRDIPRDLTPMKN